MTSSFGFSLDTASSLGGLAALVEAGDDSYTAAIFSAMAFRFSETFGAASEDAILR